MTPELREGAQRFLDLHYGGRCELLAAVEVLWSNWECDSMAALIRLEDGTVKVVRPDGTAGSGPPETTMEMLEERLVEYERAISETRAFLLLANAMTNGDDHV